jgi:hypothetical protein
MEDHEKLVRPESEDVLLPDAVEELARQQSTLTDLLHSIDDDARLMDASLEDAHEIAASICKVIKQSAFGPRGPLDPFLYRDNHDILESARLDENDTHEVYADDLERHRRRQRKDLTVAESDADKFAVVKRRRGYITTLRALHAQISCILELLRSRHASS